MRIIFRAVLIVALLSLSVYAQDKLLTIDDIYSSDTSVRIPFGGSLVRVSWTPDGKSFRQIQGGKLVRVNAETGESQVFYDADRFAAQLQSVALMSANDARLTANSVTLKFNEAETAILVSHNNDLWYYTIASGRLVRLTNNIEPELEPDFSPDGRWVSFVRENNLFVVEVDRGREKQLTRDGNDTVLMVTSYGFTKRSYTAAATNAAIGGRRIRHASRSYASTKASCRTLY